jgi:hypothetical protein
LRLRRKSQDFIAINPLALLVLPYPFLKKLKFVTSKPLEILLNFSFNSGIVPENFKLARVVPVFKSGA